MIVNNMNSLVFFIVAILGIIIIFGIDTELPIWARITCGILIGAFIVAGILNMLFGYKGMGSNVSFDDKDKNQNTAINMDQRKPTGSLDHTLTTNSENKKEDS